MAFRATYKYIFLSLSFAIQRISLLPFCVGVPERVSVVVILCVSRFVCRGNIQISEGTQPKCKAIN